MRPIVVTASEGEEFDAIRDITWPRIAAYAEKHSFDFTAIDMPEAIDRPSSWKKLHAIAVGFQTHDTVIWVDADVYPLNFSDNIMDGVPGECWQAMVRHTTNEGEVPNAGVWILRRHMLPLVVGAAMVDEMIHHRWWEQAVIVGALGYVEQDGILRHETETDLFRHTHWLDESWNVCRYTPAGTKQNWLHACGCIDGRLAVIKGWDRAANA
jgi:hypothetical protein